MHVYVFLELQQRPSGNGCDAPAYYRSAMAIVERVRAVGAFLEGVKCTAHFKVFADSQKESLLQTFRDEAIDVATASVLLDAVKALTLSKGDIQALVCGVGEAASRPRAPVPLPYNQGQDFRGFVQFFLGRGMGRVA